MTPDVNQIIIFSQPDIYESYLYTDHSYLTFLEIGNRVLTQLEVISIFSYSRLKPQHTKWPLPQLIQAWLLLYSLFIYPNSVQDALLSNQFITSQYKFHG